MSRDQPESVKKLLDIIEQRSLNILFQPIIDLVNSNVIGYEGQVRGPSDDLLHSPVRLFHLAREADLLLELENLCHRMTVDSFVELQLQGILFLRVNGDVFRQHKFKEIQVEQTISNAGLDPQRIVISLCMEEPYDVSEPGLLSKLVSRYGEMGYKVAVDDQGEVFSLLRAQPEACPSCVKINRYLMQGIDKDPAKVHLVKALLESLSRLGAIAIAEGIGTRGELLLAKELGIALGQGSFIAGASRKPLRVTPREVGNVLESAKAEKKNGDSEHKGINAILEKAPLFSLENNNEEVFQVFEKNPQLSVVAVANKGVPIGLINRSVFINRYARPYQRELYGRKSCTTFMDPEPLIVDRNISIQTLSHLLAEDQRHVSLGFIFTENGRYLGVGTSQNLIHEITEMQIQSARYANPLTGLPGNTPIDEYIDKMLAGDEPFCVCYFDLDNFKPFNDVYGFSMGDAMIQMTAKVICAQSDPDLDFVGHIGGDDYIVVFRSTDWEARCRAMLDRFGADAKSFFKPADIERGGYITENRRGEKEFHNLTTLSIGAVPVKPGMFDSHRDVAVVAAESKKMAKKLHGNSLFINQRNYARDAA